MVAKGELHAWLYILEGHIGRNKRLTLSPGMCKELYAILVPKRHRPKKTTWERANDQLRAIGLRNLLRAELARIEASGERPKGGRKAKALENVARLKRLSVRQLEWRMKLPKKPRP